MTSQAACPPDHKHAVTSQCYIQHKCRCDDCRAGNTKRQDRRRRLEAYGQWEARRSARAAHDHINALRSEHGITINEFATLSGVNRRMVWAITKDPDCRVEADTERRVLAVTGEERCFAPGSTIPSKGARRRIRALAAIGYTNRDIMAAAGLNVSYASQILKQPTITRSVHAAIAEAYERLSATPAPTSFGGRRAILRAAREGWAPPHAWDDIDNPRERPKGVALTRTEAA